MLKMICDKCGTNCGNVGYDVLVRSLHNPHPHDHRDMAAPSVTDEPFDRVRFVLCAKCYREKFKLPNIYECVDRGKIVWRDEL